MKEFGKKIGTLGLIMSIAFSAAACSIDISSLTDDDDAVDMIYRTDAEDVTLYVFRYGDQIIETGHYYKIDLDEDLEDAGFYKVVADVTYLDGGVSGYCKMPEIRNVESIEKISIDDMNFPSIRDEHFGIMSLEGYSDGDYALIARTNTAILKDGKWVYVYDTYYRTPDNVFKYYRNGITEAQIDKGCASGVLCCEDYFVTPSYK